MYITYISHLIIAELYNHDQSLNWDKLNS